MVHISSACLTPKCWQLPPDEAHLGTCSPAHRAECHVLNHQYFPRLWAKSCRATPPCFHCWLNTEWLEWRPPAEVSLRTINVKTALLKWASSFYIHWIVEMDLEALLLCFRRRNRLGEAIHLVKVAQLATPGINPGLLMTCPASHHSLPHPILLILFQDLPSLLL